jgi:2-keto-4-pentenoate hydratase/2-oxohepta-3-ene-1,7-dioic acid hydratase in catechol pathway
MSGPSSLPASADASWGQHRGVALGQARPEYQFWFNKQVQCINGSYHGIVMPRVSEQLDYEVELGVVIGKK